MSEATIRGTEKDGIAYITLIYCHICFQLTQDLALEVGSLHLFQTQALFHVSLRLLFWGQAAPPPPNPLMGRNKNGKNTVPLRTAGRWSCSDRSPCFQSSMKCVCSGKAGPMHGKPIDGGEAQLGTSPGCLNFPSWFLLML